jgi:hypothetical protein
LGINKLQILLNFFQKRFKKGLYGIVKGCRFALAKGMMVLIWEFIESVGCRAKKDKAKINQNNFCWIKKKVLHLHPL